MESETEHHDEMVWPPPPLGSVSLASWFPFRFLDLRVQGKVSDFRSGWIGIEPTGITIHGKIATGLRWQMVFWPLYLVHHWLPFHLWLFLLVAFVVCLLLLYLFRKSTTLILPWNQVGQIVLDKEKRRGGIVYDVPDQTGKIKTYSLVFALNAAVYPSFVSAVEQYAPAGGLADKLRGESLAPLLVIVLNAIVVVLVAFLLSRLLIGHH
jgi:hypothetical protein